MSATAYSRIQTSATMSLSGWALRHRGGLATIANRSHGLKRPREMSGFWKKVGLVTCLVVLPTILLATATAADQANLVRNGGFETIDRDGMPEQWKTSGNRRLVEQELSADKGRDGGRCAKLHCRRLEHKTSGCHAMLSQMDVPLKQGQSYRLTFWAKGKTLPPTW